VLGPHQHDPNWEEEQNGAANNLGVFGEIPTLMILSNFIMCLTSMLI
jgi:hypothetical protein